MGQGGGNQMGKIIKTCSACEFWDVENAKDKIAECLWKFPSMPISRGLVTPSLWASISKVRGDAGGNCPCWKVRSNLEEKGITLSIVQEMVQL